MPRGTAETVRGKSALFCAAISHPHVCAPSYYYSDLNTSAPCDETGCSTHKVNLKAGQKRRPSREEDYESDDGFVANDGSDVEKGRSNKKQKKESKGKRKLEVNGKKEQFWEVRLEIPPFLPRGGRCDLEQGR